MISPKLLLQEHAQASDGAFPTPGDPLHQQASGVYYRWIFIKVHVSVARSESSHTRDISNSQHDPEVSIDPACRKKDLSNTLLGPI
eukprot:SAG11_NODE_323_length_10745_cov_18.203926_2_plen_86_part_00